MKKLALALVAVLMFAPAMSVQAMMINEYLDQTIISAPQPDGDGEEIIMELERKLLPVFKKMAEMMYKETDTTKPEKFEKLWEKAEAAVSKYTDEITEDDLAECNIQLRAELAALFAQKGVEVSAEDLEKIKVTDLSIMKTISNFILLAMLADEFGETGKLTQMETMLVSSAIQERMITKMVALIPVDAD